MLIGITHTMGSEHKWQKYLEWLHQIDSSVEHVMLSYKHDNLGALQECDGLVLTGGHDVSPALYGGPVNHATITDVDVKRDDFEMKALEKALEAKMPVLGICRGMQLANVFMGGTLIPDIEEAGFPTHRGYKDVLPVHRVIAEPDSLLVSITGSNDGNINSSHHQAVDKPGADLRICACAEDGIAEAIEWKDGADKSFLLLVQWHPERMNDFNNNYCFNILNSFLTVSSNYSNILRNQER